MLSAGASGVAASAVAILAMTLCLSSCVASENTCASDHQVAENCRSCSLASYDICCADSEIQHSCSDSQRRRRDTDAVLESPYNALDTILYRVASRGRPSPFLGKRSPRYMLGKRPRNNFLGKRDSSDLSDAIPLLDYLEQEAAQKRAAMRPFLGKKARPMLGKRGYDLDSLFEDASVDALDEDKRRGMPFLGKRANQGTRPFLGKRADAVDDFLHLDNSDMDKRSRRPFLGKRGRRPFLGKRDFQSDGLEDEDIKRAARYMLGKREAGFNEDD